MPESTLLATVEQLSARVGEPIATPAEVSLAEAMLQYASDQALIYGSANWSPETLPGVVRSVIIEAASRGYQHPAGYEMERADSVTFNVNEEWLRSAEFTDAQIDLVRKASARKGRSRSLSSSRGNRFVSRSERRCWPPFMRVPYCPDEDVPVAGRLDAFAFNASDERCD